MPPQGLDDVGDEPIYCEAHDDHIEYSGSDDDYYEAPQHRRLRIEAKAVQFLNGHVPYLLSATLQGPFDNESWNNPWKSKRAQREAHNRRSQSPRSMSEVGATKRHGSGRTSDDLPNTQRTSLYPLPSPETTNPPSPRKNALLDETEYSRIKTWREAVKSVPVTKDPFWASRQSETQDTRIARKRPADGNWLHTRGSKKSKLPETRTSPLAASPSQTAARTRRNQASRPSASKTTSAPGSLHHEDMQLPVTTRGLLQPAPSSQHSKRRLAFLESDVSEDELSMPSTTSPFDISRYSTRKSLSPTKHLSLGQQNRADSQNSTSQSPGGQPSGEQLVLEQLQDSCLSTSQRSGMDMAKSLADNAARRALAESQQDDSFHFHAKRKLSAEQTQAIPPSTRLLDKTTTILPPAQIRVPASTDNSTRGCGHGHLEADNGVALACTGSQTKPTTTDGQDSISVLDAEDGLDRRFQVGTNDGSDSRCQVESLQRNESGPGLGSIRDQQHGASKQLQHETDESHAHSGSDRSTNVCTQELSPVSLHLDPRPVEIATVSANDAPRHTLAMDGADASNSDWSTYINTQDLTNTSERSLWAAGIAEHVETSSQDNHDVTDPSWATLADTHDQTATTAQEEMLSEVVHGIEIVEQDPHDVSDSEWLTFAVTQDQSASQSKQNDDTEDKQKQVADIDANKQGGQRPADEDSVESDLDRASYMSGVPHRLGHTSPGPVQIGAVDPGLKFSQVSVGAIIDAYAEEDQPSNETEYSMEGSSKTESLRHSIGSSPSRRKQKASEPEVRPSQNSCESAGALEGPVTSIARRHDDERNVPQQDQAEDISSTTLDETTASTESQMSHSLQTPRTHPSVMADFDGAHGTAATVHSRKPQSPWHGENNPQNSGARMKISDILNDAIPNLEETAAQSPWTKESMEPPLRAASSNEATLDQNPASLSLLAGEATPSSETPQTPWVGDKLPSPNLSMSVKRFSDFMGPSPTKKRFSSNGSILRGSAMRSRVLFGTPVPEKPKRRVVFAPLPGEEEADSADVNMNDENEVFVEEDVSYLDVKGNKTSSIRVVRPMARASSPPPSQVHTGNADELPDFDHKFARHFEMMSKRSTVTAKRTPRLLPSDSQPTNASQEVGAMAEAFIEASQTRRKTAELAKTETHGNFRKDDPCAAGHFSPVAKNLIEEQENAEPADEVSAVLDNLSDFLDNTWGFDMSMDVCADEETPAQQQAKPAVGRFDDAGDPLLAMEVNVWAD